MKKIRVTLISALALVALNGCDDPAGQPGQAAMAAATGAYQTCAACHGAEGQGNAALQAPALVNLDDWYLKRQLGNFRNGLRGTHPDDQWGQQMTASAAALPDDAAVEAVVAQIASFPDHVPAATLEGDTGNGRDYYNMVCGACHGPNGSGNPTLNAPSLQGIDDWYLARQYGNFRDGIRGAHVNDTYGQQMLRMGQVLKTDQDIRDVVAWLQSVGIEN